MRLDDGPVRVGLDRTASCGKLMAPGSWLAGACAGKGLPVQARSGNPTAASGPSGLYVVSVTVSGHLLPLNGAGEGGHRRACEALAPASSCGPEPAAKRSWRRNWGGPGGPAGERGAR